MARRSIRHCPWNPARKIIAALQQLLLRLHPLRRRRRPGPAAQWRSPSHPSTCVCVCRRRRRRHYRCYGFESSNRATPIRAHRRRRGQATSSARKIEGKFESLQADQSITQLNNLLSSEILPPYLRKIISHWPNDVHRERQTSEFGRWSRALRCFTQTNRRTPFSRLRRWSTARVSPPPPQRDASTTGVGGRGKQGVSAKLHPKCKLQFIHWHCPTPWDDTRYTHYGL